MARHLDKSRTNRKENAQVMAKNSLEIYKTPSGSDAQKTHEFMITTTEESCTEKSDKEKGIPELNHVLQRLDSEYLEQLESKLPPSVQHLQQDSYYSPSSPESGYLTSTFYMEPSSPSCSLVSTCSSRGPVIKHGSHHDDDLDESFDDDERRAEISLYANSISSPATPLMLSPLCGNSITSPSTPSVLSPLCGHSISSPATPMPVLSPHWGNSIPSPAMQPVLSPLCTMITSRTNEELRLTQEDDKALDMITNIIDEDQTENILNEAEISQYDFMPDESFPDLDVGENTSVCKYMYNLFAPLTCKSR